MFESPAFGYVKWNEFIVEMKRKAKAVPSEKKATKEKKEKKEKKERIPKSVGGKPLIADAVHLLGY